jgi:hypothetical protein
MKLLYQKILDTFAENKQIFEDLGLIAPMFIDLYDSQPEIPDQFEFMCPAIFIDYNITWSKTGNVRTGTLQVEIHVLTSDFPETDSRSRRLPEGLKKIDYYETVVNLLEGLATAETSGLELIAERPVSTDYFNYHVLTFQCNISRIFGDNTRFADGKIESIDYQSNIKQYLID